jgi:hypothetical protein
MQDYEPDTGLDASTGPSQTTSIEYRDPDEILNALARLTDDDRVVLNGVLSALVIDKRAPTLAVLMDAASNQFDLTYTPWAMGGTVEVTGRDAAEFEVTSLQVVTNE